MENKILTAILLASALCGTACGGAKQVREDQSEDKKECQIHWYEYETGRRGVTEFMPKAEIVKRIKAIKALPGFIKPQTDQWVNCR